MSNKRVIGVLKRARALVAKGWIQGVLKAKVKGRNCFCAWGAVDRATTSDALEDEALLALDSDSRVKAYVTRFKLFDSANKPIVNFNDASGRKQSQIVALFDRTIARLERQTS